MPLIVWAVAFLVVLIGTLASIFCRIVFRSFEQENRMAEAAIEDAITRSEQDALTGLYNHATLFRNLAACMVRAETKQEHLTVLLLDIDHFKYINDDYGHAVGDVTLVALAEVLQSTLTGAEFAARAGGEEFVVVLPGKDLHKGIAKAEAIRTRVERDLQITLSAGVAEWDGVADMETLLDLADRRMYAAKQAGRNRTFAGAGISVEDAAEVEAAAEVLLPVEEEVEEQFPLREQLRSRFRTFRERSYVENPELKHEIFLLFLQQSGAAAILWILLTLIFTRSLPALLTYAVILGFILVLFAIFRRARKQTTLQWLYGIYSAGLGILLLPTMYLFCGGAYSGVPILFVMAAVASALLLNGLLLLTVQAFTITSFFFTLVLDHYIPDSLDKFTYLTNGEAYLYTFLAVVFVGFTIGRVMRMLQRNYLENRAFGKLLMNEVEESARKDPLSVAYDRRYLVTYLSETAELVQSGDLSVFSVLMFDIDHFKQINDRYGHLAGDACIRSLASLVRSNLRAEDALIRYGGEEFICVLRGATLETAIKRAEKIRASVERTRLTTEVPETVTISCGVVSYAGQTDPDTLIRDADEFLYKAKRRGRNRVAYP